MSHPFFSKKESMNVLEQSLPRQIKSLIWNCKDFKCILCILHTYSAERFKNLKIWLCAHLLISSPLQQTLVFYEYPTYLLLSVPFSHKVPGTHLWLNRLGLFLGGLVLGALLGIMMCPSKTTLEFVQFGHWLNNLSKSLKKQRRFALLWILSSSRDNFVMGHINRS